MKTARKPIKEQKIQPRQVFLLENLIRNLVLEASIDQLKTQFVNSGKLTQDVFDDIVKASGNKGAYATWLASRVDSKALKAEDVYKYERYLKIFSQYKNRFPEKDLFKYKTSRDIANFNRTATDIIDKLASSSGSGKEGNKKNYVSIKGIADLKAVGINFIGKVDGFQVFEIPKSLKSNQEAWKAYRNILGRCSGREAGEDIELCTVGAFKNWESFLTKDDMYVFFNMGDAQSPYQFHYADNMFMDKNDDPII
jgi:hypothetical protein